MSHFYIDGEQVPFNKGDNVLQAALSRGIEIPHFCHHPALGSLGACRLCAVEIRDPSQPQQTPRLCMACMEAAAPDIEVSVQAPAAVQFRKLVIEWLMTRHPHDCPVCDEGGECHLQNMTVISGHGRRRYLGNKTTFPNQDMGPLLHHEMNRCITCYRCVRFYRDYAGGRDLGAMRLRNEVWFGRHQPGPLESPFAGNLVEVCPTGVFTDNVFRHNFCRLWDLKQTPGICGHCSVGCHINTGSRPAGKQPAPDQLRQTGVRRIRNRACADINPWFLCDRGRYGFRFAQQDTRPLRYMLEGSPCTARQASDKVESLINNATGIAAVGSPRVDLATMARLKAWVESRGGKFTGFSDAVLAQRIRQIVSHPAASETVAGIENRDAIVVLGDIGSHAPVFALSVRQAVKRGASLFIVHHQQTGLHELAHKARFLSPRDTAQWLQQRLTGGDDPIDRAMAGASAPLIIAVAETLPDGGVECLQSWCDRLDNCALMFALPAANAYGAALLSQAGTMEILEQIETGVVDTLVIMAQDPWRESPLGTRWSRALEKLAGLIVLDYIANRLMSRAQVFMPMESWLESDGVFVNYQGRAQGFQAAVSPPDGIKPAAVLLQQLFAVTDVNVMLNRFIPGYRHPGDQGCQLTVNSHGKGKPPAMAVPATRQDYEAVMQSWYGDEVCAAHAPELQQLAPEDVVSIAATDAADLGLRDGDSLLLLGSADGVQPLRLPVEVSHTMAGRCLGLNRRALAQLGLNHGDPVAWEQVS